MNARKSQVVKVACPHDCPDTCGMLVTVQDGVATKIQGDPTMPFTEGTLCTKVAHYLERTYSPDRLTYPQKRVGKKGEGKFKRISWDEALDEIAARLKALEPETILPCSYAGTMGMVQYMSMDRRFFNKLGASQLDRTLCSSAGKAGIKATLGGSVGMDPERFDEAKLIILWGANPIVSNLHLWSRVQEAKRCGAKVIAIDPYRSLSAEKCTQHVALLPGTDGALALAMMHVLIAEDLIDRDYIAKCSANGSSNTRRSGRPGCAACKSRRSSSSRANTAGPAPRPSASTTACSATPVVASRRATSPACRRWSAPGATSRAGSCSRRPTSTSSTTPRSSGPIC
jgi:anaerobic selenocysteine-containing dehydrogenase